jgi:hypothetical protein
VRIIFENLRYVLEMVINCSDKQFQAERTGNVSTKSTDIQINDKHVQCSLDLPFFKGQTKKIGECGKTVNRKNNFF